MNKFKVGKYVQAKEPFPYLVIKEGVYLVTAVEGHYIQLFGVFGEFEDTHFKHSKNKPYG